MVTALVGVVVLLLAAWGLSTRLAAQRPTEPDAPSAAPPPSTRATGPSGATGATAKAAVPIGPPPWVRYPTPLEGRWVTGLLPDQLTLVVANATLDVYRDGADWPGRGPYEHRTITVVGDRVIVRAPGDPDQVSVYGWVVRGDRLSFELVEHTPRSSTLLAGLTFDRT